MNTGLDVAASGMLSVLNYNDILANNLANVSTPGFKGSFATFRNVQEELINNPGGSNNYSNRVPGALSVKNILDSTIVDTSQGSLKETGNPLEFAIHGKGFFTVDTSNGTAYTRNGAFVKSVEGKLVNKDGFPILVERANKNQVELSEDTKDFLITNEEHFFIKGDISKLDIDEKGNIQLNGKLIGRFKIADFKDTENIKPIGNYLFGAKDNYPDAVKPSEDFKLHRGALELSNTNVVETMINSIKASRTYETLAKVVEQTDRGVSKAINDVGQMKR